MFEKSTYPLGGVVYHVVGDIDPMLKRQIRAGDINLWLFLSMHQWCFVQQEEGESKGWNFWNINTEGKGEKTKKNKDDQNEVKGKSGGKSWDRGQVDYYCFEDFDTAEGIGARG